MGYAVGIDLGTTNSVAAVVEGGQPSVVINADGYRITPSAVAVAASGEVLVGHAARRQAAVAPDRTFLSVKRRMGTDWHAEVDGDIWRPEAVSARILLALKRDVEAQVGDAVSSAVVTVPAHFNDAQRQATRDACDIAGIPSVRIVNEPTAAAIAAAVGSGDTDRLVAVFDLGGGTLDVTIMSGTGGVYDVRATSGDTQLGGDDFDTVLIDLLADRFLLDNPGSGDPREDPTARRRLTEAAIEAKHELSSRAEVAVSVPFLTGGDRGPAHLEVTVARAEFEQASADLLDRCRAVWHQALEDARVAAGDLHDVLLVGGATRMPMIRAVIADAVAARPSGSLNPDESVAVGAALHAASLANGSHDVLLLDVTPLTLGIETAGGALTPLIPRNTTVPTRRSKTFTTSSDGQERVSVHVCQGERPMAADNHSLGTFTLTGIPPAPKGTPRIEVSFDIDADGIVSVSAVDEASGSAQNMTASGTSTLDRDDIRRLIADAEASAEQDRRTRAELEAREAAAHARGQAERLLGRDDIPDLHRRRVGDAVAALADAEQGGAAAAVTSAAHALTGEVFAAGEQLHRRPGRSRDDAAAD